MTAGRMPSPGPLLAAFVLAWAVLNAATLSQFPLPWVDEIQFADPAVRWVGGQGFTSSVWIAQGPAETWAGNAPMYSLLLAGWLTVFGASVDAVRSLNLVLALLLAGLVGWLAASRGWIRTRAGLVALVALVLCGHSVAFAMRMGRYDVLGMLLFAAGALLWTGPPDRARLAALAAVAALAPATGLALVPAALLYVAAALAFQGRAAWPRALAVAGGLAVGALALWAALSALGLWPAFRASTSAVGVIGQGLQAKLLALPRVWTVDKSSLLLALAALLLWSARGPVRRRPLAFALVLAAVLPPALQLLGKFPVYYGWMVLGPLAVAVCGAWPEASSLRVRSLLAGLLVAGAVLVGLPLRLAAAAGSGGAEAAVAAWVAQAVRPDDRIVGDFKVYYAARLHAEPARRDAAGYVATTAVQTLSPAEREAVTLLLLRPADHAAVAAAVGGAWEPVGQPLQVPAGGPPLLRRAVRELEDQALDLQAYRRRGAGPREP